MTRRRIAFLDLDGTILDGGVRIAPSTVEAIGTARSRGHLVYLSTGRVLPELDPNVLDLGFDGMITAGGGFAQIGSKLVVSHSMASESVERLVSFYESAGYDFYLQSYDSVRPSPGVHARLQAHRSGLSGEAVTPPDAAATIPRTGLECSEPDLHPPFRGIAKTVFLGDDPRAFELVARRFGDEFHVITGTIPNLGSGSGEVSPTGVTKGATILELLALLGEDAADSIGIGDGGNDIEMLEVCGIGIAMGNASAQVKAHADEITTSVVDDGVWNAFRRHGLV